MISRKILLVDDEASLVECLGEVLRRCGFAVTCDTEPAIALHRMAEGLHPDIVIADYHMPGMNGVQLIRKIKELDPMVAAIIITGRGDLDAFQTANMLGIDDFIEKPFPMQKLVVTIRKALEVKDCIKHACLQLKAQGEGVSHA